MERTTYTRETSMCQESYWESEKARMEFSMVRSALFIRLSTTLRIVEYSFDIY